MFTNGSGNFNTSYGTQALFSTTRLVDSLTAIGFNALYSNTTGQSNIATGLGALRSNTTGSYNTACGTQALSYR